VKLPPACRRAAMLGRAASRRWVGVSLMTLRRARRRTGGSAVWLSGLVLLLGLSGCNSAIETYRSVSGMNKNDPDPATAPFEANLDKAETGGYPNLASVPPPPEIATTLAERQALTASLTGTRSATEANGGTASPGPVPPPPAIPSGLQAPETSTNAQPLPLPTKLPPPRPVDEPPPLPPQNTAMQVPTLATPPGFAASHPAPAEGHPSAMPQPAPSALPPAAVASGNPQPSPPPASLPPAKPSPEVAALPPPKLPPVPVTAATLDLAPGAAAVPAEAGPRLAEIVKQYQERPRTVRIVSYAAPASGGAEQLNAFRTALDRAQLVADALTGDGIPKSKIQTEASPASGSAPPGRVEVQLMP